jgi:hypothetical protein
VINDALRKMDNLTGSGEFVSYRFYDCIDVEVVDAIIKENCGLEIRWLKSVLDAGVWVRGKTGRRIKATRQRLLLEKL